MARKPVRARWTPSAAAASLVAAAALLVAAAGCSTAIALTDKGKNVSHTTDADRPGGCRLIGDVAIGVPPDAARPRTENDLVVLMRNKAGEMGGSHVVVDMKEERNPESEDGSYWIGRGRAYSCPESESTGPAEDDTGLPPEEEETDEGDAEGDAEEDVVTEEPADEAPGGVSNDDLLDAI